MPYNHRFGYAKGLWAFHDIFFTNIKGDSEKNQKIKLSLRVLNKPGSFWHLLNIPDGSCLLMPDVPEFRMNSDSIAISAFIYFQ